MEFERARVPRSLVPLSLDKDSLREKAKVEAAPRLRIAKAARR